ncbi:MAG TPA: ribosome silencing factor [Bryobacteraceae bacterium]|nr:ribosome silencing factor [Bryobacteraceae bacterium]
MRSPNSPENTPDDAVVAPLTAARAAESKKAIDVRIFDLRGVSSFTDFFVICSGTNTRQIQTIADAIAGELKKAGQTGLGLEGYDTAEWVLLDYGDFIVHIFSEKARSFYDLERLWRQAKEIKLPDGVPQP